MTTYGEIGEVGKFHYQLNPGHKVYFSQNAKHHLMHVWCETCGANLGAFPVTQPDANDVA